ncbi:hypothetical protein KQX54_018873 [Cotesia glomerata]|uniref:Uncharacterized protein n=1 Tax=Cotesia glomerata TaxID=32391 RepID=A0AAV7I9G6_COTGL|nr:hypothetical protein KQX54_018873 [Cotesia glomerata]
MQIDQVARLHKELRLNLAKFREFRENKDSDKEKLNMDVILEEVTLIKEEIKSAREEMKSEINKLSELIVKLDQKCRRINDGSEDLQVRLNAALEKAKLAEEQLQKERKNNIFREETERMLKLSAMENYEKILKGFEQEDEEDEEDEGDKGDEEDEDEEDEEASPKFDWVNYRFRIRNLMQELFHSENAQF